MNNSKNTKQHISFHLTNSSKVLNEEIHPIKIKYNKVEDFKQIDIVQKNKDIIEEM